MYQWQWNCPILKNLKLITFKLFKILSCKKKTLEINKDHHIPKLTVSSNYTA